MKSEDYLLLLPTSQDFRRLVNQVRTDTSSAEEQHCVYVGRK